MKMFNLQYGRLEKWFEKHLGWFFTNGYKSIVTNQAKNK